LQIPQINKGKNTAEKAYHGYGHLESDCCSQGAPQVDACHFHATNFRKLHRQTMFHNFAIGAN